MNWIKDKLLLILGLVAGIASIAARYFYYQSKKMEVKVKQGDAKLIAEKEKADLEKTMTEVKNAEAYRRSLVDQWRRNSSDDT